MHQATYFVLNRMRMLYSEVQLQCEAATGGWRVFNSPPGTKTIFVTQVKRARLTFCRNGFKHVDCLLLCVVGGKGVWIGFGSSCIL